MLKTNYMGLILKNPLIVSSSGLTNSVNKIKKLEKAGIGAVVLKSLFEEQINGEINATLAGSDYPEALDYVQNYVKANSVNDYLQLIRNCKEQCTIPIIASINCCSKGEWVNFAKEIEKAGADGLELNVFILDGSTYAAPGAYEAEYLNIYKSVRAVTSLPVSMKIGRHFSSITHLAAQLSHAGLNSLVLFNRYYQPDIDLDKMAMKSGEVFSTSHDLGEVLRWVSLVSGSNTQLNLSASTGIHDWDAVIKVILAGVSTAQICSTVYANGVGVISQILTCIEEWMTLKGYSSIDEIKGLLSAKHPQHASFYERAQFMKYVEQPSNLNS